jgi:hypothetical protein
VAESSPPSSGTRSATLIYELTNDPGPHVLVVSAGVGAQAGSYALKQSRWAPDLEVSGSFTLAEGEALEASLFAQDPDEPGKTLEFAMLAAPPGAVFNVAGPTNAAIDWPTAESTGPSTNLFVVSVADTVNGRTFRRTNAFSVVVQEINVAPVLTVPPSLAIDELAPWSVQVSAEDADLPPNPLAFSLLSPPAGMSIDPATGWIDWLPTEEQGPSTNVVTVVVTDQSPHAANATSLSATNSFVVVVREVNSPPQLVLPPAQTIDELSTWLASVQASDSDLPANSLTLSLVAGPPGLTLDPATGALRWTPSEAQGPGTNIVTIALADFNADAAGERILAVTNSFAVVVREINTPPQLAVPDLQTVAEGQLLDVSAVATDSDLPANSISYSLAAPPAGAAIDAATGRITWSPAEAQGPSTNLLVVVATDSSPGAANGASMSTTNSFTVIVTEVNEAPVLPAQADRSLAEGSALVVTNTATDADLPAHGLSYRLAAGPASAAVSPAGVITWTPTEADGPGSYVFTTAVADDGLPQRSATNSFVVTVSEVNLPPVLRSIPAQTVRFGSAWSLQAEAEDADLPANTLSFSMVEGPAGLGVQASSGELSWTPAENQIGSHFATLRVADNGSPEGSATIRFEITVTGRQSSLGIQQLANGLIQIRIEGENGVLYRLERSADLVAWEEQVELRLSASPFLYILPDSAGQSRRFFRLRMAQ